MTAGTTSRDGARTVPRGLLSGELWFAIAIAATGGYVLVATGDIYQPASTTVGPRVFPYVVGAALLVLGILTVVQVLRGKQGTAEDSEDLDADATTSWLTVVGLVVVLLVHVNLIVPAGWPAACAVLFAGSAFVLGSRRIVLTIAIAIALALLAQFLFANRLGLGLPPGPLLEGVTWLNG